MTDPIAVARNSMTSTTVSKNTDSAHASAGGLSDMASSTSIKQTSSLKGPSFFALPPEIRISIYQCIIYSSANGPESKPKFWHFHNFFLSSKAIRDEFEDEWVKIHNKRINGLLVEWPLHMGSVPSPIRLSNFADTKNIQILLSGATNDTFPSYEAEHLAHHFLSRLVSTIGTFTMKPMGWPTLPDNSVRAFVTSRTFQEMLKIRNALQKMNQVGRYHINLDYCGARVSCSPAFDADRYRFASRRHWLFLPRELIYKIFKRVIDSCQFIEDLREWRGVLDSCPRANLCFELFLYGHFLRGDVN
ncbi:hypothetical protein FB567DRAFT_626075 [Paraphoma chrysanthemicola]|uniref:Uncharacterized protein n=1 Tax=Paraphoma chrysanthemicola TaxID=798071 RepID=A0A8K0RCB1_9PLEO|nr:hypothetical protein FB567DRAFT_626075 [Paraphoma chrysanthemicola]